MKNVILFQNDTWSIQWVKLSDHYKLKIEQRKLGTSEWPIQYANGTIAYDHPETIPTYIQKQVIQIFNQLNK